MKLCQSLSCWSSQAPCVSVSSLCWLSHSSPLVGLSSGASHSLPFDCHGDTHLHSKILSLFYLSLHFLGEPSASVVKHRLVRGAALDTQISLLPLTAAHGAQLRSCTAGLVVAQQNTPEPQAAAQQPHISPAWSRSAAAVVSQRVMREQPL